MVTMPSNLAKRLTALENKNIPYGFFTFFLLVLHYWESFSPPEVLPSLLCSGRFLTHAPFCSLNLMSCGVCATTCWVCSRSLHWWFLPAWVPHVDSAPHLGGPGCYPLLFPAGRSARLVTGVVKMSFVHSSYLLLQSTAISAQRFLSENTAVIFLFHASCSSTPHLRTQELIWRLYCEYFEA